MKNEEFKRVVASNLVYFRKKKGLTQQELAEQLNYSDKAISKWCKAYNLPSKKTEINTYSDEEWALI